MKLIIDIPEKGYKKIKEYFANDDYGHPSDLAISKGIPLEEELEKIKAEIEKHNIADFIAVQSVLDILNKYISELEGDSK